MHASAGVCLLSLDCVAVILYLSFYSVMVAIRTSHNSSSSLNASCCQGVRLAEHLLFSGERLKKKKKRVDIFLWGKTHDKRGIGPLLFSLLR